MIKPVDTLPAPGAPPVAYRDAFPNSTRVHVDGPGRIRVPMREIALSGGEPPLRVYDTSGPPGHDVREGLPPLREPWIAARDVRVTGRAATITPGQRDDPLDHPPRHPPTTPRRRGPR
ncbi:MAG: hypothetical protein F4168_18075, partial [Gemmatimonadetes bacterium]|nr:hypothetical protein [Gemmatimonadota bacterium]